MAGSRVVGTHAGTYASTVTKVLLVEDDDAIAGPLERALAREGYDVARVANGAAALDGAADRADIVVLDLGLPDMDGLEVCRTLRARGSCVAVLMLTARGDELDRVVGLDVGADDYLGKPFGFAELLARMRALLRRAAVAAPMQAQASSTTGLQIDAAARRVTVGDTEVTLTPKEFELLTLLASEPGRAVTRERIMEEVWDENWFGSTKTLDMTLARLRQKLADGGVEDQIVTIRGVGFRFEPASGA
jgi:DNA-binding response OmpR family regulator